MLSSSFYTNDSDEDDDDDDDGDDDDADGEDDDCDTVSGDDSGRKLLTRVLDKISGSILLL